MNIGIIFFTAIMNGLLQAMSKNIIYCYVFLIYTLGAMAIDLYNKKYGKIFMAAIFLAYAILLSVCIYNHIIYDVILLDYIFVSIETVIVATLTAVAILPIKEKSLSRKRETFSTQSDEGILTFVWGGTK